jgi:hypothetical protein
LRHNTHKGNNRCVFEVPVSRLLMMTGGVAQPLGVMSGCAAGSAGAHDLSGRASACEKRSKQQPRCAITIDGGLSLHVIQDPVASSLSCAV